MKKAKVLMIFSVLMIQLFVVLCSIKDVNAYSGSNLITYNPTTNIMTALAFNSSYPCNFEELYQADIRNASYSVITKQGANQYLFNCRIILGNGTIKGTVYFTDSNKQVTFSDNIVSAHYQAFIELKNYAYATFGILEDLTTKTTSRGIDFRVGENYYTTYLTHSESNTYVYFYSCSFAGNGSTVNLAFDYYLRLWNCNLSYMCSTLCRPTNSFFNSVIEKTGIGLGYPNVAFCDRISVTDVTSVAYIRYTATITNLYARRYTNLCYASSLAEGQKLYLIDANADIWSMYFDATSNGEVFRQYTFNITTTTNSTILIRYYGSGGGIVYNSTDIDGTYQTTLTKGFYNKTGSNTIYSYEPYNLEISQEGYKTVSFNFTLTDKTIWNIPLSDLTETYEMLFIGIIALAVSVCALGVYVKRR